MASITANIKDGKTVSYKFKCFLGRTEKGKQIFRCTTWKAPESLTPSKAERAAKAAANEWEKQIKAEYEQDLKDPARVKAREIDRAKTDFADFIQNTWFPLRVCDGEHMYDYLYTDDEEMDLPSNTTEEEVNQYYHKYVELGRRHYLYGDKKR
ncbi:MAG: hypothetical protein PHD32_00245 [Eubacteriales bacterium]|nr:hypothetical protein [Eubacteriales bacterium]